MTGSGGFSTDAGRPEELLPLIDTTCRKPQQIELHSIGQIHRYSALVTENSPSGHLILLQNSGPGPGFDMAYEEADYLQNAVKDAIPDVIILKDPEGRWIRHNRAAEELREYSPFFEASRPFLSPDCRNSDIEAWSSDSFVRLDEKLPDGRIFDVTKTAIRKPDGSPHSLLVFARDVTESRHREIRLQALNSMIGTLKTIDRLIIGCLKPDSLVQGVVTTLAESMLFRSCAALTAPFESYPEYFFKAPESNSVSEESFRQLDKVSWGDPVIEGEDLQKILPELKDDIRWAAARISHSDKLFGYLIAGVNQGFEELSQSSLGSVLGDITDDLAYALQGMELNAVQKRSASQVLETRNMLDSFLENFPGPAFIRDSSSRYLKMNRGLMSLFGGDQFQMRDPSEIYPGDILSVLLERDQEVLDRGYLRRERVIQLPDRGDRTFEVHYFRIDRADGDPLIGGIALDLTERIEADNALLKSEERYRTIYENTGTAIAIIDPQGIIASVNANAEELSGYSKEEVSGIMQWTDFVHPEDRKRVAENRRKRLDSVENTHSDYEFRLLRKDGAVRHVRVRTGTIPNSNGTGVLSLSDVTALIDYQKQLNLSLEKTQAILNAIPDLMFVLTRDGHYRDFYANDENMLALPPDELAGKGITDIGLEEKTAVDIVQAISETLDTGVIGSVEYDLELPDGHHYYEAGMSPFESDSVLVLCRDVTARKNAEREQKKLEAQVRHVQKLESLGLLAGGIAHDFNNILMAITGNIYLAKKSIEEDSSPDEYLDAVEKAAGRASDLAGQMLAYSGRGEFRISPLNLNAVAEEISGILNATVSKKAEVSYQLDPELPLILADNTQVRQVIMNLITNASEALEGKPGRLIISTGVLFCDEVYIQTLNRTEELKPGHYAWIQIDDSGKGMDQSVMDRIFDPFFTTKFTGRGLGLSAVLGIMSSHGGALRIESVLEEGSSFRALFPVTEHIGDQAVETMKEADWQASGTVLFVDDEPVIRSVARTILGSMGFSVITAVDGLDGLNSFRDSHPGISLVILDLTMPNMDGDEVFREIREISGTIPVLISSGYNENEILSRFSGCPPDGFLKKPYTAKELKNKIGSILHL